MPVSVDVYRRKLCPPCHLLSPILDEIAAELSDKLTVATMNVDENQVIAQRYGILAMPTLSVFRDGEVISQVVGARPKRRLLADLNGLLSVFCQRTSPDCYRLRIRFVTTKNAVMTTTTPATVSRDALIVAWRHSPARKEQIAAELAAKIVGGRYHYWAELDTLGALAREYDTSQRTISAAKNLLAAWGFLVKDNKRYYVVAG